MEELAQWCRMREGLNPPWEFQPLDKQFGRIQTGSIMHKRGEKSRPGMVSELVTSFEDAFLSSSYAG